MSVSGKYTTIYDVIERVRRSGFSDFTEEEAKEWVWEVISLGGAPKHFEDKVAILPIEDARATLPYDLYDITEGGVRDYYTKYPLFKETNIYYNSDEIVANSANKVMLQTEGQSVVYIDGIRQTEDLDTFISELPGYSAYTQDKATYKINHGFLFAGFKTGVVELAYKAFPTDNENNPMIEDNFVVIRAVVAYIKKIVAERMWLRDEISEKKKNVFDQQYSFAIGAMVSDAAIGSVEDMEAIRARMNRLYRDPNLQKIGFDGYGVGESLNLNEQNITNRTWARRL